MKRILIIAFLLVSPLHAVRPPRDHKPKQKSCIVAMAKGCCFMWAVSTIIQCALPGPQLGKQVEINKFPEIKDDAAHYTLISIGNPEAEMGCNPHSSYMSSISQHVFDSGATHRRR